MKLKKIHKALNDISESYHRLEEKLDKFEGVERENAVLVQRCEQLEIKLEDEEEDFPLAGIKKRYINKVGLKCLAHMYFVSLL